MQLLLRAFHDGGFMMYPILGLGLVLCIISFERFAALYFKSNINKDKFFASLTAHLLKADFEGMIKICDANPAPLSRVTKACLIKMMNRGNDAEIQAALDEGALIEIPKIEKSIGFLAVIGNVATLMGLLGTISGLIGSFAAVANADAATKAAKLTSGISEAMSCTAFGLIVAVPAVILYSIFQNRAQRLVDDLNEISIRTLNFIVSNRERFGIHQKAA